MQVLIPVMPYAVGTTIVGIRDMLVLTENFLSFLPEELMPDVKARPWFQVHTVSTGSVTAVNCLGVALTADYTLSTAPKPDVIIIPALVGAPSQWFAHDAALLGWLEQLAAAGTLICSTCSGAFFLAEAGILNHKKATTSWFMADLFRTMYPAVELESERRLVHAGNVITSGATMAYQQLCIYLIEKYYGHGIGSYAAKIYLTEKGDDNQSRFSVFTGASTHQDKAIGTVQTYLHQHALDNPGLEQLSEMVNLSVRTLLRKFKQATGLTPGDYVVKVKMEQAKALLELGELQVKEVAYDLGYQDLGAFRAAFKKHTGITPAEYKALFSWPN